MPYSPTHTLQTCSHTFSLSFEKGVLNYYRADQSGRFDTHDAGVSLTPVSAHVTVSFALCSLFKCCRTLVDEFDIPLIKDKALETCVIESACSSSLVSLKTFDITT